jgi:RecA/RadA recombinase
MSSTNFKAALRDIRKTTKSESFASSKYGEVQGWISTGDYGLNRIISGSLFRGIPTGRVVLLGGESQSGKSFLAAQIASNALNQENYDIIFYFDSEGGAMKTFFESRGCDPEKIEQVLVDSVEDASVKILSTYKKIEAFKASNPDFQALFILDSLGALVANKYITDAEKGKVVSDMGGRAKIVNNMVKGLTIPALRSDTSIIIVNHVYDDPGSMFPSKIKSQGGGKGLQYMSRITLQCSKLLEKEVNPGAANAYKATILKFFTVKNSLVKPFYYSKMYLNFAEGPHKYFGLIDIAKEYGFITTPTHSVPTYEKAPDKKFRLKALLEEDEAWDSFLHLLDERSKIDMSYSGSDNLDDLTEDMLENSLLEEEEREEEQSA